MTKMKVIFVVALCLSVVWAFPSVKDAAEECNSDVCDDGCRCCSNQSPLELDKTPQLISLTWDEAVVENLFQSYWSDILMRENPDGEPIGATFFVPHEYTDYSRVNALYNFGYEIGVHSISKNYDQKYWREGSLDTLKSEFEGQKEIISKFANIPPEDIIGARTPQLQLNGNVSIQAYQSAELKYDSSWPTLPNQPLFPYTLDYLSTQQCTVTAKCPNEPFKGFWILPIVDLTTKDGGACNSLGECGQNGTKTEILSWLESEVSRVKKTKVPLTIRITSLWFEQVKDSFGAFLEFLNNLKEDKDIFLVSQKQVYEWIQNPVEISEFKTDTPIRTQACNKVTCRLEKTADEIRYMNSCVACPDVYPWLGNPEGKSK